MGSTGHPGENLDTHRFVAQSLFARFWMRALLRERRGPGLVHLALVFLDGILGVGYDRPKLNLGAVSAAFAACMHACFYYA